MRLIIIYTLLLIILYFGSGAAEAQQPDDQLRREILMQDSLLFDAFNRRDVAGFSNMLSLDLEFFHDKGGLKGFDHSVQSLQSLISSGNDLNRTLVVGSTKVYPIPAYGAVQLAAHTFCHTEDGRKDCGTFQFVHVWKKDTKGWKITRVVSYGH